MRADGQDVIADLEAGFFRTLNLIVEPAVRAGFGSPGPLPTGLIVLETKGPRSGRWHRTPVLATGLGGCFVVGTVRGRRSQWVRRLRRTAAVRYWNRGELWDARGIVFAPDKEPPDLRSLPLTVTLLGLNLAWAAEDLGCAFALLVPPPA